MFKSFFKITFIAFMLLILFAYLSQAIFSTVLFLGDTFIEPAIGLGLILLFIFAACIVSFLFIVGLIGVIAFVLLCVAFSIVLSGLSIIWPLLLIGGIIWFVVKDSKKTPSY